MLDVSIDDDIRRSYKGGAVQVHPGREGQTVYDGASFDVNSMYPWAMLQPMPCGVPIFFEGKYKSDPDYPLYIQHILCEFKIKEGYIPTIQIKNNLSYQQNKYLTESVEQTHLYLTSVDLKLFFDHYDVYNYEYINGWKFQVVYDIFKPYVEYWYEIKKTETGAKRAIAKQMLNAFYGKTASRVHIKSKIPYMGEDDIVHYKYTEEETKKPVYTAVASFITSYGRDKILRTAQSLGGTRPDSYFCYMDTDSVHTCNLSVEDAAKYIDIDQYRLGAFKLEYTCKRARYIRQKCYIEEQEFTDGTQTYTNYIRKCAGMPEDVKEWISWDAFNLGFEFDPESENLPKDLIRKIKSNGVDINNHAAFRHEVERYAKLQPVNVPGGVVLKPIRFSIKP